MTNTQRIIDLFEKKFVSTNKATGHKYLNSKCMLKPVEQFLASELEGLTISEEEFMMFEHMQRAWLEKVTKETHPDWLKLSSSLKMKLRQQIKAELRNKLQGGKE